jgi:hypothetical protein
MRWPAAALVLAALFAQPAGAARVLAVPQVADGYALVLHVRAGVLRRGAEIDVYGNGVLLGTVSPFATRGGDEAGTYTLALPDTLQHARRIALKFVLTEAGRKPRVPTARELRDARLAAIPVR